jgi:hypothetical protein
VANANNPSVQGISISSGRFDRSDDKSRGATGNCVECFNEPRWNQPKFRSLSDDDDDVPYDNDNVPNDNDNVPNDNDNVPNDNDNVPNDNDAAYDNDQYDNDNDNVPNDNDNDNDRAIDNNVACDHDQYDNDNDRAIDNNVAAAAATSVDDDHVNDASSI